MASSAGDSSTAGWQAPLNGSPCWIEIPGRDLEKQKAFYAAIFPLWDWRAANPETDGDDTVRRYSFADHNGLSGGIVKVSDNSPCTAQLPGSGMTVYYMVDSLDETKQRVQENGGKIVIDRTAEGAFGWYMNFHDPEGNRFACYEMQRG
ncbi:Glyoxalase/Bleomycin resistance protein/Dihydroxybiphenyl dioxygenase [Aspergillus pseudodeflectus]|uniref:Glyoxalase/Bleomycin resistance protein/Dihydroxybiphenyl dioxygenase n=1 Tax=Aspergillus pseudodeflectus TaxID=176178 RepID=A0ABR4L368_9EURO